MRRYFKQEDEIAEYKLYLKRVREFEEEMSEIRENFGVAESCC